MPVFERTVELTAIDVASLPSAGRYCGVTAVEACSAYPSRGRGPVCGRAGIGEVAEAGPWEGVQAASRAWPWRGRVRWLAYRGGMASVLAHK